MNSLMRKLEKIQDECVEKKGLAQDDPNDKSDEFTRLKKKVAFELNEVRQLIKNRDELELSTSGTRHTVEASHQIRSKIKAVKAEAQNLDALQKKERAKYEKKNKTVPEKEQQIENREELVGLVFQHIKEVESLNNRKHGDSSFGSQTESSDPTITELPNIDDEGFQLLRRNDAIIDKHLEDISGSVGVLKEMAIEMGKEAELQGVMLDKLGDKVDVVNDQLESLNTRLRKALESVRKGDRFIIDIILLCVLLGIAGYIYSLVKK